MTRSDRKRSVVYLSGVNPDCSGLWCLRRWSQIHLRRMWAKTLPVILNSVVPTVIVAVPSIPFPFPGRDDHAPSRSWRMASDCQIAAKTARKPHAIGSPPVCSCSAGIPHMPAAFPLFSFDVASLTSVKVRGSLPMGESATGIPNSLKFFTRFLLIFWGKIWTRIPEKSLLILLCG